MMNKKGAMGIATIAIISATALFLLTGALLNVFSTAPNNYILEGNKVYFNDSNAFIQVEPHTLKDNGYIYLNLTSKVFTGNIDMIALVDTDSIEFKSIELYKPTITTSQFSYQCNGDYFNYTLSPKYAWCWKNQTTTFNASNYPAIVHTAYPTTLVFGHAFETGNITTKVINWSENKTEYWGQFPSSITTQAINWNGLNKAYIAANLPVIAGTNYQVRLWTETKINTAGKYWIAFKRSSQTINEAIAADQLYYLDPWWNNSYRLVQTYQISQLLPTIGGDDVTASRFTYVLNSSLVMNSTAATGAFFDTSGLISASKLDSNCGGFRIVNASNTTILNTERGICNGKTAIYFSPNYPTTNANTTDQQIRIFYGDAENITNDIHGSVWANGAVKKAITVYTFDINSSSTLTINGVINDSTVNRLNATIGTQPPDISINSSGIIGQALFTTGLQTVTAATLPLTSWDSLMDNLTISVWFKQDGVNGNANQNIWTKYTAVVDGQVVIGAAGTNCGIANITGTYVSVGQNVLPALNRWHYDVCTYDGANVKHYLDGQLLGTAAHYGIIQKTAGSAFRLSEQTVSANRVQGLIDEFRIYNYSFSAEEINATYESTINTLVGTEEVALDTNTYAIFYSSNVTAPARYDGITMTRFNITVENNNGTVILQTNITGSMVNFTMLNNTSPTNFYFQAVIPATVGYDLTGRIFTFSSVGAVSNSSGWIYNFSSARGIPVIIISNGTPSINSSLNTTGLVGYWRFEGNDLNDSSGYGNFGNVTGANATAVEGKFGNALNFDGKNDFVNLGNSAIFNFSTGDFTLSAWVKTNRTTGNHRIIDSYGDNFVGQRGYILGVSVNKFNAFIGAAQTDITGTTTIQNNVWYHVALVRTGNDAYLYVNGIVDGTITGISARVASFRKALYIGAEPNDNGALFNGTIDEVTIWNRTLSPDEILMLNGSRAVYGNTTLVLQQPESSYPDNLTYVMYRNQTEVSNSAGLVGYWKFDNDTRDSSGFGNTGTMGGANATPATGRFGEAYSFDGVNDIVDVGNSAILNIANYSTVTAWVKPNHAGDVGYIIAKTDTGSVNSGWGFSWQATDDTIKIYGGSTSPVSSNAVFSDTDTWVFAAFTISDNQITFYRNGVAAGTATTAIPSNSVNVLIGDRISGTATSKFNGTIDEVRIYNRTLSTQEIIEMYNQTRPRGAEYYISNTTGNANYTAHESPVVPLTIDPAVLNGNLYINGTQASQTWSYPNATNVTATTGSRINNEGVLFLLRNLTEIGIRNGANFAMNESLLGASIYNFTVAWVGYNYTFTNITYDLTITKGVPILAIATNNSFPSGSGNVLYLSFDENATQTAYDSSGYGNDATWTGANNVTRNMTGKYGNALTFDGTNDFVDIGMNVLGTSQSQQTTITGWMNFRTLAPPANKQFTFIGKHDAAESNEFLLSWNFSDVGGWAVTVEGTSVWFPKALAQPTTNAWDHYAFVIDTAADTTSIYKNGVLAGTNTTTIPSFNFDTTTSGTHPWNLGQEWDGGDTVSDFFDGSMDEVRIYNYSMSADEINASARGVWNDIAETYPNATNVTGFIRLGDLSASINMTRNGTRVSNSSANFLTDSLYLAAGIYEYNLTYTESQNYTAKNVSKILNVPQGSLAFNLYINGTEGSVTYTYPNGTNATLTISPRYNNEGAFSLLRNDTPVGSGGINNRTEEMLFGVGIYNYSANASGFANYTITDILSGRLLTILKNDQLATINNVTLEFRRVGQTFTSLLFVNFTGTDDFQNYSNRSSFAWNFTRLGNQSQFSNTSLIIELGNLTSPVYRNITINLTNSAPLTYNMTFNFTLNGYYQNETGTANKTFQLVAYNLTFGSLSAQNINFTWNLLSPDNSARIESGVLNRSIQIFTSNMFVTNKTVWFGDWVNETKENLTLQVESQSFGAVYVNGAVNAFYNFSVNGTLRFVNFTDVFIDMTNLLNSTRYVNVTQTNFTVSVNYSLIYPSQLHYFNVTNATNQTHAYELGNYSINATVISPFVKRTYTGTVVVNETELLIKNTLCYEIPINRLTEWNNRDDALTQWFVDYSTSNVTRSSAGNNNTLCVGSTHSAAGTLPERMHPFELIWYTSAPGSGSQSGGGGGAQITTVPLTPSFIIEPMLYEVVIPKGQTSEREFKITNNGTNIVSLSVEFTGDFASYAKVTSIRRTGELLVSGLDENQPQFIVVDPGNVRFITVRITMPESAIGGDTIGMQFMDSQGGAKLVATIRLRPSEEILDVSGITSEVTRKLTWGVNFAPSCTVEGQTMSSIDLGVTETNITPGGLCIRGQTQFGVPFVGTGLVAGSFLGTSSIVRKRKEFRKAGGTANAVAAVAALAVFLAL